MRSLLLRWAILAVAIVVTSRLLPGFELRGGFEGAFIVAAVLGLVNAFIRPIISLLTCPLIILTLGLFTLIINALMLVVTAWLVPGYLFMEGPVTTILASIIISIISAVLTLVIVEQNR